MEALSLPFGNEVNPGDQLSLSFRDLGRDIYRPIPVTEHFLDGLVKL